MFDKRSSQELFLISCALESAQLISCALESVRQCDTKKDLDAAIERVKGLEKPIKDLMLDLKVFESLAIGRINREMLEIKYNALEAEIADGE